MQKVLALCKKRKNATICTVENEQWVGVGAAYYKLEGMPRVETENEFRTLAGMGQDTNVVMAEECPDFVDFGDYNAQNESVRWMDAAVCLDDRKYCGFAAESGVVVVAEEYMQMFGGDDLQVEVRESKMMTGDTIRYVCVLEGMILMGCIFEAKFSANVTTDVGDLQRILKAIVSQTGD